MSGTTVTMHPFIPGLAYTTPHVTRDPDELALLMDCEPGGDGTNRDFPDLWDRLQAQEGCEEAARIWKKACIARDALTRTEDAD
ncbi:hypothetical protein [Streptomyces sp. YS415]|uniref:hypothetical protein n=1 Tax=Streptomyces sp. YS415 TaxID=2944806 RepID=UPI0020202EAF|nr:hypothetical protein [Streptomyces sp. YS415]MCL7429782.1 hypothetical protein [Streptomyces sp. YS415]